MNVEAQLIKFFSTIFDGHTSAEQFLLTWDSGPIVDKDSPGKFKEINDLIIQMPLADALTSKYTYIRVCREIYEQHKQL